MDCEQMETIGEYLTALDKARRADDDWFFGAAIKNRAGTDGNA
jgi:hypothetical protein